MRIHLSKLSLLWAVSVLAVAQPAHASLVYEGVISLNGAGLGAVDTVLTMQETGRGDGVENGAVSWTGTSDAATGPDVMTGSSQTQTILALGPVDALRVIFNPNEPGDPAGKPITLDNLVLSLFSGSGSVLFTSGVFNPEAFLDAGQGTGSAGFAFLLDSSQTTSLNVALAGGGLGSRYGLSAQASGAAGGPEAFFIAQDISPVPLPAALPLFASGLGGLGLLTWWRKRKERRRAVAG